MDAKTFDRIKEKERIASTVYRSLEGQSIYSAGELEEVLQPLGELSLIKTPVDGVDLTAELGTSIDSIPKSSKEVFGMRVGTPHGYFGFTYKPGEGYSLKGNYASGGIGTLI